MRLARRNEALEDFAALLAHELKTPLQEALLADEPRRSIEGAYIRRDAKPTVDRTGRMSPETYSRLGPVAMYLLELI